jgi:mono/diheme cytochrome c family protein
MIEALNSEEGPFMRIVRWVGIALGVLAGLLAVAVAAVYIVSGVRLNKAYQIADEPIAIPTDAASIERGHYLATTIGQCVDCHGENLAGKNFLDAPGIGSFYSANLTSGAGGAGKTFSDADWVRALRHGVGKDGKPLVIMPAQGFNALSAEDLGALIAYVKSVPPVDNVLPASDVQILGRALFVAGQINALAAESIDHSAPIAPATQRNVTPEYGRYLVRVGGCVDCHGANLSGGPITGAPPDAPPAPNITPGGEISAWSDAQFIQTMRTGVNPAGKQLSSFMPYKYLGKLSDDELKAMFLYLESLPAEQYNTR